MVENSIKVSSHRPSASRRSILKWASAVAASAVAFGVDIEHLKLTEAFARDAVDLGSGDIGVLNYAYALEQLEAAFYTNVLDQPYSGMSSAERSILSDIRGHEIAHRDFFKSALGAKRIPNLSVNFKAVNFRDRESVLNTAKTFEDLGVSAYNGGGAAIKDVKYLAAAGSIVSVEARHAAVIRDLLEPRTTAFAGDSVVDGNGLDVARPPSKVLGLAGPFIATPVTAEKLP